MNSYAQQNNHSGGKTVVMQQKSKIVQEPPPPSKNSSLHQRKPSHPVTNNYMLELLSGQQVQPPNPLIQSVGPSNNVMVDKMPREKKQPSQSKKASANNSAGGISATGHQRSVSDYIHQHYQNEQQQNKLLKFLNGVSGAMPQDQFDYEQNQEMMIESFEGNIVDNQTPLESYRGQPISAALQNFMQ